MAKVLAINTSERTGEVKHPVPSAAFAPGGIIGDAHFGLDAVRQVSLLAVESADKMRALGATINSGSFAENITTEGIDLKALPIGTRLRIGETVQEVSQIGKQCHHGCAIRQTTGTCVMPTEGIFTIVIHGGTVASGDPIEIIEETEE